jgi:uncharacterized protein with ParB-like and HNH nuclease domain
MENNELKTLLQIFDEGRRGFKIPDYQRGYSWEEKHVMDFLQDLTNIKDREYKHFAGTIVASLPSMKEPDCIKNTYDIVDGQQRLTTIIILISEILRDRRLKEGNDFLIGEGIEKKKLSEIFIQRMESPGTTKRLFKLNSETDGFFVERIFRNSDHLPPVLNKSHKNIATAKEIIRNFVNSNEDQVVKILKAVIHKIGFLFYAPENHKEIGMMFEVINNRGKRLSQLEQVKNYLIYYAIRNNIEDLRNEVNSSWHRILENLNVAGKTTNEEENAFLKTCWIVLEDHSKYNSSYVYDSMKQKYPADASPKIVNENFSNLLLFVNFLKDASLTYAKLFAQPNHFMNSPEEKEILTLLSLQQSIASVVPLIVAVYHRNIDESKKELKFLFPQENS